MQSSGEINRGLTCGKNGGEPSMVSDNLALKYSGLADDGAGGAKKKEAAMLFSVAEGHLNDDAADEGLAQAKDALNIFRSIGATAGVADSLRLVMHATRMKSVDLRTAGDAEEAIKLLEDAERSMRDEMQNFQEAGDKRGQACMLLAIAEARQALGGSPKCSEALDNLLDAQDLAQEIGDSKLEALVVHAKASVLHSKHNFKAALQAAKDAAALFKSAEDARNEGFAYYSQGAADINCGRLEEGLRGKTKALKIWKEIGDKKLQAAALASFAEWYVLEKDDHQAGLAAAKEAADLYKGLSDKAGESTARCWIIEAHIRNKDIAQAVEVADSALEAAKENGDKKSIFWALENQTRAHLANGDQEKAMEAAQECASISAEISDKRFNARGLETLAGAHAASGDFASAVEKAQDAVELAKESRGFEEEAFKTMQFLAQTLLQSGSAKEANKVLEQARGIAQRADDTYLEGIAMLGIAGTHAMAGDAGMAQKASTLAREMFHEEGFMRGEARALKASSEFFMQQGDYSSAVRAATEGAEMMEEFGDNRFAAILKHTLATVHLFSDQPAEAAKASMDALKLARMDEDKRATVQMLFMALDSNNIILQDAAADEKQSKTFKQGCEKMMRFAKEAVGIAVKIKDSGLEAAANYWVAHLHMMAGQVREGMQAGAKTISLAKENKDTALEVRTMVLTAHAHLALGEQPNAVKVLNDAVSIAQEANESESQSMANTLLETIIGSQQAAPQWNPAMMAQWEAAAGAGGGASEAQMDVYKAPEPMMVRQYIMGLVQNMTGSSDEIDGDTPLMESGIDSLASVELRTQLQQEFRLNLPSTVMFNYPTISTMTRLLVDECTQKKISWG